MSTSDRVVEAMSATPREGYLTSGQRPNAGQDTALPLFKGQTNSQPSTVARMLELLDVPEGARVLDVGAGSGWTTAILAHLVGPAGTVLGLELEPELAAWGADNLAATGRSWARIDTARADVLGAPETGPYDRILVSAMARALPDDLVDQLAPGGVIVIPVVGRMWRVTRGEKSPEAAAHESGGASPDTPMRWWRRHDPDGSETPPPAVDRSNEIHIEKFGNYRFVPLITD